MKTFLHSIAAFFSLLTAFSATAQTSAKSLLINHGSSACGNANAEQQFFSGSLTTTPSMVYNGSVGVPYGGVFAAYNPKDNKLYYADINGTTTKIYVANYNFGGALSTPSVPTPTYTYNYIVNQLCFDNAGNNYCFRSFNAANGKAKLEKINIDDGTTIGGTTKDLQFPSGRIPNTVGDGDMVVLPNGRMFATFGNSPSMLYEFTFKPNGDFVVNYLTNLPRTCYSIAYVDGNLVVAGSDGGGCYYYIWDINSVALSSAYTFPASKSSADMTNMTEGVGATNQITGMRSINSNTAQIYYQIVIKNKGNIYMNNVQLSNDLNKTFGAGNVLNAQVSFQTNPANLQLNPLYNGTTVTNMLSSNQYLDNDPIPSNWAVINLVVTATNLVANKVYYNSAVATGSLGSGTTYLAVSDSSNNGAVERMDLDNNGVSDDPGENVPTPFVFTSGVLPVQGLTLQGVKQDETVKLNWENPGVDEYVAYEIERSVDGANFVKIGSMADAHKTAYAFSDNIATVNSGGVFYTIKGIKANNTVAFSNTVYVKKNAAIGLGVYPNPFQSTVSLQLQTSASGIATVSVKDLTGRTLYSKNATVGKGSNFLTLTELQNAQPGAYFIEVVCGGEKSFVKVVKQ